MTDLGTDWTRGEFAAVFDLSFADLLFEAQKIHRANHPRNEVQLSTLLSIKTGGRPEDCGYCNQSASADSGLKAEKLMDVDEVLASARDAKENGSGRFCMGAAWRSPKDRDMPKITARKSAVPGTRVSVRVDLGGRRTIKKTKTTHT